MEQTGKTTRLIDRLVQEFFNNGIVYIYDGRENDKMKHHKLLSKMLSRLSIEHPQAKYTYNYDCIDNIWCYKLEKHDL